MQPLRSGSSTSASGSRSCSSVPAAVTQDQQARRHSPAAGRSRKNNDAISRGSSRRRVAVRARAVPSAGGASRGGSARRTAHRAGSRARAHPPRCATRRASASSRPAPGHGRRAAPHTSRTPSRTGPPRPARRRRSEQRWRRSSVGARSSLLAASGPAAAFSASSELGPEHPEAPRVGEVMVGRPASELEQLVEQLARDRIGCERLMRAPAADCVLNLHRCVNRIWMRAYTQMRCPVE